MQFVTHVSRFAVTILFCGTAGVVVPAPAQVQDCSMDKMEVSPSSVLEPCSDLLNEPNLSAEQKGLALFIRGRGFHRTGRLDAARHDYDEALRLTPRNDEIYVSRANLAFREGDDALGLALLHDALTINPKNARAMQSRGTRYNAAGNPDEAIKWFSRALEVHSTEPFSLLARSRTYAYQQRYELAFKDADALVAIPSDVINRAGYLDKNAHVLDFHVVALKHRAELHGATGRPDLAERDLDAAVAHKWSAQALIARGAFLWARKGRGQEALRDADAAAVLDPENPIAHNVRAYVLASLGRHEAALRSFDRVIELDPYRSDAYFERGRMHRELDEVDEAVNDTVTAMLIDPSLIARTVPALQHAGYWMSRDVPKQITEEFLDAIHACMLDKTCN
jgi:tetratricopeptide (TPR) repeat protein